MTHDPLDLDAVEARVRDGLGHQDSCANPWEGMPYDNKGTPCTCGVTDARHALYAIVTRLRAAEAENARLRPLAQLAAKVLAHYQEHDRGDLDGAEIQEWAVQTGAMTEEAHTVPCGDVCRCAEYYTTGETARCVPITDWALVQELASAVASHDDQGCPKCNRMQRTCADCDDVGDDAARTPDGAR